MLGGLLLCCGDSLTFGARDEFSLSYPRILGRLLSKKHSQSWVCVERGINGEKSGDFLRRFYGIVHEFENASQVLVWIGTNDAKHPALPPDIYEENIREIVTACKFAGKPLLLGTLPERHGFGAPDFIDNKAINEYNKRLQRIVEGETYPTVQLVKLDDIPVKYKCDGVHHTFEGNIWIAKRFQEVIEKQWS
jgi:lysophospholipase L1-like esterase